jgi:hypothetical protein
MNDEIAIGHPVSASAGDESPLRPSKGSAPHYGATIRCLSQLRHSRCL